MIEELDLEQEKFEREKSCVDGVGGCSIGLTNLKIKYQTLRSTLPAPTQGQYLDSNNI